MCVYFCIGFIHFMLAGKTLIDHTSLFCHHDFEKNDNIILRDKAPSIHSNSHDETLFRLNKVNTIEDYFTTEIKKIEAISKRLNKYIAAFEVIDNILIVLSATSGGISIISFLALLELL